MVLGFILSLYFFFSTFSPKAQSITRTTQTQTTQTTQTLTYEDLITEEKEITQERKQQEPQQLQEPPKPTEEIPSKSNFFLVLEKTTLPKKESLDLIPEGPKIIYLP